jgi:hypothetical protein
MPNTEFQSPTLRLDLVDAKLRDLIEKLGKLEVGSSHPIPVGPLLPGYNGPNQPCHQSYYQPPRDHEFAVDPTSLRQIDDYDYNIGTPMDSSDDGLIEDYDSNIRTPMDSSYDGPLTTPNQVPEFDQQTPNLSIPFIVHPVPANTSECIKRSSEDEEAKPNKKRRT